MTTADLCSLPSIDRLLQTTEAATWIEQFGLAYVTAAMRQAVTNERENRKLSGRGTTYKHILESAYALLLEWSMTTLEPVINATGVVLHTNLGRAPLSADSLREAQMGATAYSTLEFDMETGKRGHREEHLQKSLQMLVGAEATHLCNNNAAAVLLVLTALARRKPVIIARSQLVEIGGGFRVPEVMKHSGAKLIEVGTTNRVNLQDYRSALEEYPTALVMRVHPSNFKVIGFAAEPALKELVTLAHGFDRIVIDDIGSGALIDTSAYGLGHEPMVQESLAAGSDLVCFSGDKLIGGPQAGIIVGRSDLIQKVARHPLARAVRIDKLTLAALHSTLQSFLTGKYETEIPIWQMISKPLDAIRRTAENWQAQIGAGKVVANVSMIGGGSLPAETMPTFVLRIPVPKPQNTLEALRSGANPVIARIDDGAVVLDPRTVFEWQNEAVILKLKKTFQEGRTNS